MGSRGKSLIEVPDNVKVNIEGKRVSVAGSLGELSLVVPEEIEVSLSDRKIRVFPVCDAGRGSTALQGTISALINNMLVGVTHGYTKALVIEGMGYRASIDKGGALNLQIGCANPVKYTPPEGIKIEVPDPHRILIKGIDKQLVGDVAAKIRSFKPPEPYKGKGIRYEGEYIRKKAGKKAGYGAGASS